MAVLKILPLSRYQIQEALSVFVLPSLGTHPQPFVFHTQLTVHYEMYPRQQKNKIKKTHTCKSIISEMIKHSRCKIGRKCSYLQQLTNTTVKY